MHSAPAVSCPAAPSRNVVLGAGMLWAAGAVCSFAAVATMNHVVGDGWRVASMLGVSVLSGVTAWRHFLRSTSGPLNFDGQQWSFGGRPGHLRICLDFQSLMLIRLVAPGYPTRWLWMQKDRANGQWRDVRRAVYSRAPTASDAGEPAKMPPAASRSLSSR